MSRKDSTSETDRERQAGAPARTVAITVHVEEYSEASAEQIGRLAQEADHFARLLEREDCPEAFREAFAAVFTDQILNVAHLDLARGNALRVLYVLALSDIRGFAPEAAGTVRDTLITLRDALMPEGAVNEVLGEAGGAR